MNAVNVLEFVGIQAQGKPSTTDVLQTISEHFVAKIPYLFNILFHYFHILNFI